MGPRSRPFRPADRAGPFSIERRGAVALVAAGTAVLATALPTLAQEPPRSLEPTRPAENLTPSSLPRAAPQTVVPLLREQTPVEQAGSIAFSFSELRLEGARSIDRETLLAEWRHEPGDVVTVADLFAFAGALTRVYSEQGYPLSFGVVPEQQIRDGVVTIRVVEGFVAEIAIVGDDVDARTSAQLRAIADPLTDLRPLRMDRLERSLLLINDLPGVRARATLSPSPDVEGGAVLTLEIARNGDGAQLDYNSFLPDALDRHAVGVSAELNGVVGGASALRLGAWKSVESDAFWSALGEFSVVVGEDGMRLALESVYSETTPTTELMRALEYEARALTVRASASYPLMRSRRSNLYLGASVAAVDADSELLGAPELRDRVRSVEASLAYDRAGADQSATWLRVGLEQGVDGFGAEGNSRANGDASFTALSGALQRTQTLVRLRRGEVSAFSSAYVQIAVDGPLLSAAECAYGGRQYGRRYDAGALAGDHCALGLLELRWTRPYGWSGARGAMQLYGFVDAAHVAQWGALEPDEKRRIEAASAGVGLRLDVGERARGTLEIGHGLDTPDELTDEEDWRLTGGLSVRF